MGVAGEIQRTLVPSQGRSESEEIFRWSDFQIRRAVLGDLGTGCVALDRPRPRELVQYQVRWEGWQLPPWRRYMKELVVVWRKWQAIRRYMEAYW